MQVLTPERVQKLENDENHIITDENETKEIPCSLSVHFENGVFKTLDRLLFFKCKKLIYVYDADKNEFVKLRGLDYGVRSDVFHQCTGLNYHEQFMRYVRSSKFSIIKFIIYLCLL